ncbi:MAG: CHAD domain-containing protein [Chloroflexi bacterium]|nr:CHAD domain-containing protein [Chloroflexota bacterium]
MSASDGPLEVELKYRITGPLELETVLGYAEDAGLHAEGEAVEVRVRDRYIDTPDGRLAAAAVAARLRHRADGVVVTVKTPGSRHGAVVRRTELESPATGSLAPSEWPASPARDVVAAHAAGEPLVEIVTLDQVRTAVDLVTDGAQVSLTLDDVTVVAEGRVVDRFAELEAELASGDEAALHRLAERLAREPALAHDAGTKLERAMLAVADAGITTAPVFGEAAEARAAALETAALERDAEAVVAALVGGPERLVDAPPSPSDDAAAGEPAAAGAAEPRPSEPAIPAVVSIAVRPPGKTPGVTGDDPFAEAGRKVLRFHFARMLAHEDGTREGSDAEELHAMRVATRRMRAAWRVFGSAYRPGRAQRMRGHLKEVATRLGAVRDLDVLIEGLRAYQGALPGGERAGIDPLITAWEAERDDARILLLRDLDSAAYRQWVTAYSHFVVTEGLGALPPLTPTSPLRVREMAGSRIWVAYEDVRAYEATLRWADLATLHQLRITAKRLRYAIEFFREALGPDAAYAISRTVALQDHLGALHDAEVAAGRARTFLVESSGRLSESESAAIGRYLTSREKEMARLRRTVGRPWRAVVGPSFRRALARAIATL